MTQEQSKFFKDLAERMTKQDNRATQYPLFCIYQTEEREVNEGDDYDRIVYYNDDYSEIASFTEYNEDEIPQEFYHRALLKEFSVPVESVGPFFTEKAAQDHIDANDYHYTKPYIYVTSAWRNYELQTTMKLIFELAGMEIPSCYK
jgi:hypothetical protein